MMFEDFIQHKKSIIKDTTRILYTSDTHFGHNHILSFVPERVESMKKDGWEGSHDDYMIHKWNSQVTEDDVVIHAGDFSFKSPANYFDKLNGTIILVLGNHDKKPEYYRQFENVYVVDGVWELCDNDNYKRLYPEGDHLTSALIIDNVVVSHYPLYSMDEYDLRNQRIIKTK